MPIDVTCSCGQTLTAPDSFAGKTVPCPYCADQVPVPAPAGAPTPAATGAAKPWQKGAPAAGGDPNNPFGFTSPGDNARERERQAREGAPQADGGGRSLEGRVFNGGVMGGLLAMLVAVVWFVAGLAADVIFFYPPVLFIIGLVAFFKGLAQGSSQD